MHEPRRQSSLLVNQIVDTLQTSLDDFVDSCFRELSQCPVGTMVSKLVVLNPSDVKKYGEDATMFTDIATSLDAIGTEGGAVTVAGAGEDPFHPAKPSPIAKPKQTKTSYRVQCTAVGHGGPREARSCKPCVILHLEDEVGKLGVPSDRALSRAQSHDVLQSLARNKRVGTYFCPECIGESVLRVPNRLADLARLIRAGDPAASAGELRHLFQPTNKCDGHAAVWNGGFCPCGGPWRSCAVCRVARVHPYAGLGAGKQSPRCSAAGPA